MRRFLVVSVLLLVMVARGVIGLGQGISLCDYTPPRNELATLTLSGEYHRFEDRSLDDQANVNAGNLTLNGFAFSEGPPWGYNVRGSATLRLAPTGLSLASTLRSDAQVRRYLVQESLPQDAFLFGGVDTAGVPGLQALSVNVFAGAGLGRFRNVTPMAKALRAAEALQAEGVLVEMPSPETLNELAQLIGRQRELGLPGVLQEIETTLDVSLNVAAVLALQDVLRAEMSRFCGWDISAGVGYELLDPEGKHDALVQANANYAVVLDPNGHILIGTSAHAPWSFMETGEYEVEASLDYHRILSPTADVTTTYVFTQQRDAAGILTREHLIDLVLRTRVQEDLSLTLKGHLGLGSPSAGFEEPEWGFDLGFEYTLF